MKTKTQGLLILSALIGVSGLMMTGQIVAQTLTNLHEFTAETYNPTVKALTNSDGAGPSGGMVLLGSTLYGTASAGGANGGGALFAINTNGTGFTNLYNFPYNADDPNGTSPSGSLVLSGSTFYSTTFGYAAVWTIDGGTVYSIKTDGTGFTNLHSFASAFNVTNADGAIPDTPLVVSGGMLYGATSRGGPAGNGTVFSLLTDGTGFTNLHFFSGLFGTEPGTNLDGAQPNGLVLSGNRLYGTTFFGGDLGSGVVFSVKTDGTGFTNLHSFSGSDGSGPLGLVLSSSTLYGTTWNGGPGGTGTVFALDTDGTGFATLRSFSVTTDDGGPFGPLTLWSNKLYGTASGGDFGYGLLFEINTTGTGYRVLYSFSGGSDGTVPYAPPSLVTGSTLYGTTGNGGAPGYGAVFALSLTGLQFQIPVSEYNALLDLYDNTAGASWNTSTGWLTSQPSWYGVTVTGGHVTALDLPGNQLNGTIPDSLANLSQLQVLDLASNQLSGSLPASLGNLFLLQDLDLRINQLSGSVPTELGNLSKLRVLHLGTNQFTGSIPDSFGGLSQLQGLYLTDNQFSGNIPVSLGGLTLLTNLGLGKNQLRGSIPATLGNLFRLQFLILSQNQLSGSIPAGLGNLSALQKLGLDHNELTGTIPATLGNLFRLQELYLDGNQLSGSIPAALGKLSQLQELYLGVNQLNGSIPAALDNLSKLQNLGLDHNQLGGGIPASLGNLSQLQSLYLNANELIGAIPPSLGSLTVLTNLGLDENQLSGEIPPSLGNLSQLQVLYLDVNQLSGNIPSALGDLSQLQALYLDDNDLSGEVPDFTNFTGVYIHLGYNRLDTATGSQSLANIFAMISAGNTVYYSPENGPLGTGSVQVNITPSAAIAAGAKWQGDAGSLENSGVTVAHLVAGSHTISFTPVTGWTPPANQTVTVANGQTTTLTAAYMQQFGSLYVTLTLPPGVTAGAWRVDGGAFHGSGYEVNYLTVGNHLVSFQPVNDYLTPANQTVFVVNNSTTFVAGTYVTNAYLAAQGDYVGLFVSTNSAVEPANSGYININLTTMGAFSGKLSLGSIATPFSLTGQLSLSPDGTIAISDMQVQVRKSEFLDVYLQLNTETGASEPSAPALSGFVNAFTDSTETNALWASEISAELSVPSNNLISNGLYNVTIAPVSADPSQGPGGYGYASATVAKNGAVALVLDLADGASPATSFSSHLAQDGTCPFYASLYGGNGIILGWLKFDLNGDGGVQGDSIYWVKSPAADKFYTNGFAAGTPDVGGMVVVKGSFYSPPKAGVNVLDMTSGYLVIDPNLPDEIDIPVTYNPAKNRFTDTNNVIIELNTSTGVLNGSFISPNAKARTSFTGVVFEGAGYGFYKNTNGQTGPILISNGSNPFPALTKKIEIPRRTM